MKLPVVLVLGSLWASSAQACVRILVDEVWKDSVERTREVHLWDNDKVNNRLIPFDFYGKDEDRWRGSDYRVSLNPNTDGGRVWLPGNWMQVTELKQKTRRQSTLPNGQTQVYYCLWDDYSCEKYSCSLPNPKRYVA
ncbi:unnamed protein product [Periconia digitata]|uniref:Uncharacterized protein n=1 Tax=Periconia digitata TaxID=1303443 RepID=A0A9W4U7I9_9PLEO|nr:unnamed protein product [Periconia digitata]